MRRGLVLSGCAVVVACLAIARAPGSAAAAGPAPAALPFIENAGQAPAEVAYYAPAGGGTVFVTRDGRIVHALAGAAADGSQKKGSSVREELVGARAVEVRGGRPAATTVNYLMPSAPAATRGLRTWQSVDVAGAYRGVDVELVARGGEVEKLFRVAPRARVSDIRVQVAGASGLRVTEDGRLEVETGAGPLHFTRPVAYQEREGRRDEVDVAYVTSGDTYGFRVGRYDRRLPLTIDPLLASTFLGGTAQDGYRRLGLLREPDGDVLVAGSTYSGDFPTTAGVLDPTYNGSWDIVIARLDSTLTTLETATFLGGSRDEGDSWGGGLALGPDGSVYLAASTISANFPMKIGAYDRYPNGGRDVVVSRLSSGLDTLLASTFLGGSLDDETACLMLGPQGRVYVAGYTASANFPTTEGAFDRTPGGDWNGFVSRLDPGLTTLVVSTYLGGDAIDHVGAMVLDGAGDLYMTGATGSADFPCTPGAFDTVRNAEVISGWLAKMSPDLTTLLASTYFDGSSGDFPYDVAIGTTGDVFITGHSGSSDLPTTPGAYDPTYNGSGPFNVGDDVFVSRFSPDLTALVASTFVGGNAWEMGTRVVCDGRGNVLVAGEVFSTDFPVASFAYSRTLRGTVDAFVCRLDEGLTTLQASTYLGGSMSDYFGRGLAVDPAGNVDVVGTTESSDFPTTEGVYDRTYNGAADWFICRLDPWLSDVSPVEVPSPPTEATSRLSLSVEPNPFRAHTTIHFDLAAPTPVSLRVFDASGRRVRSLLGGGVLPPGRHEVVWDATDDARREVAPGTYLCRIVTLNGSETRRLVLIR